MNKRSVQYVRGGSCPIHELIEVPEGYPRCPDHPIWLGVLEGSWYDIGKQYGESEGVRRYISPVFDYWLSLALKGFTFLNQGVPLEEGGFEKLSQAAKGLSFEALVNLLHSMEEQANLYQPNFVEAMKGEADGAAEALARSKYANDLTDYEKVLFLNFSSYLLLYALQPREDCSCIAFLPPATANGKVVVGRNTQFGLNVGNYGVAYAAVPPAPAHRFMTNPYAGRLFGLGMATDTPLYISRTAGIGGARPGIEDSLLMANGAILGNSRKEATDLIVHGSEKYRKAAGRKTTLRANPVNFTIVDAENAEVVETTTERWAVRHPGDFSEKDFIIATNHELCEYSYDEDDKRTQVPMYDELICQTFGGCRKEMAPSLKDKVFAGYSTPELVIPQPGTCTRYWALYWSAMYNHGRIDVEMLQGPLFLGSRFWYDINGRKIEYQIDPENEAWMSVYYLYYHATVEGNSGGYPEKYKNELPGSLIYVPADRTAYWELYKPSMWRGKWEQMTFQMKRR